MKRNYFNGYLLYLDFKSMNNPKPGNTDYVRKRNYFNGYLLYLDFKSMNNPKPGNTDYVRIGCSKMSDCCMRDKMIEFLNEQGIIKEDTACTGTKQI